MSTAVHRRSVFDGALPVRYFHVYLPVWERAEFKAALDVPEAGRNTRGDVKLAAA